MTLCSVSIGRAGGGECPGSCANMYENITKDNNYEEDT